MASQSARFASHSNPRRRLIRFNHQHLLDDRPKTLDRRGGYGNSKAAVDNLTKWLAVELAQKYGSGLRINAIAPGFFIGEQNRDFLLKPDGSYSDRGQLIIDHTPMGRFGEPEELVGTALWPASDAARFVTGTVIPIDGSFSAFSGV